MVSVCMATFNGEKYIESQINSILKQLGVRDELIISDDSSTDGTVEIIQRIKDSRVKLYHGCKFRDPIKNFQNALRFAKGDYIFLSDQDDIWLPEKYQDMLKLLLEYDLVVSDSIVVDETLQPIRPSFFALFNSGPGIFKNIVKSSYYGSCMAFTRKILDHAIPFPETKEIGHDLWIGLVAEIVGSVYFYDRPLLLYRRHASAFTSAGLSSSKRSLWRKIAGRAIMLKQVSKLFVRFRIFRQNGRSI